MTDLKDNVNRLNALLKRGKISEAFEKYYNVDVNIHLDGKPPVTGKEQRRDMIFLQEIEKLNSAEIMLVAFGGINDDFSVTEWEINIENKKGEKMTIYRLNVQHWKDDKIIDEKIYFCGDQKFKVED
ncbi:hypothetical protein CO038_02005 [Candidatus Pacearchaeota archaeon CG_4_9_14_0_2_um_filter_39_13]|nr:hypothetical protein [Candidatus Pacearchaeota archaeon]OIO43871.1 MAG: hypothetical protein AUJ64_01065 [Candidatus Pacearchaeota archaeon CG1_02_39_14]PJC44720.1 MAG: hypothetical protein CO038_02005 [Candidatus Pacearchaeota archaeon CG_4_9_14_0_2_um_filter_39_13]